MVEPQEASAYDERRSHRRLLVIAGVVVLAAVALAALLATRQHQANAARAAAACSDLDRATYEALTVNRPPAAPVGQDDGSCDLTLHLPGDAATALRTLDSDMTADGWTTAGTAAGPRIYSRGPVLITAMPGDSSGGTTEITLSLPPD